MLLSIILITNYIDKSNNVDIIKTAEMKEHMKAAIAYATQPDQGCEVVRKIKRKGLKDSYA